MDIYVSVMTLRYKYDERVRGGTFITIETIIACINVQQCRSVFLLQIYFSLTVLFVLQISTSDKLLLFLLSDGILNDGMDGMTRLKCLTIFNEHHNFYF